MGKQIINIAGLVVVVAVFVAGVLLIGLPLLSQSFATGDQADQVDRSNAIYAEQVASLQKEKADSAALDADVKSLQAQIPSTDKQDDVFELVASAATATGVVVKTVTASDAQPWTARSAPTVDGLDPAATTAPSDGSSGTTDQGSTGASDTATPAPTATPAAGASGGSAGAAPSPQTQIPFVIVVQASNSADLTEFIDALGKGPRLLGIVHSTLTVGDDGVYELTVNALSFVSTQK